MVDILLLLLACVAISITGLAFGLDIKGMILSYLGLGFLWFIKNERGNKK